ncbi:MAG: SMP-30/gluconolactonase/LRE family protein, partial [Candidatus Sericytochromatia bacterium]|nr:SMP-30/gluconolactonase/LRE family protein [Candidatus Sericytochromatia bacterium]
MLLLRGADATVTIAGGLSGTITATLVDASQAVIVPTFATTASTFRIRNLANGTYTLWAAVRNGGQSTPDRPVGSVTVSNNANTITGSLSTPIGTTIQRTIGLGVSEGGLATGAALFQPQALALRGNQLYVSDTLGNRVRRIDQATGLIATAVGTGLGSYLYGPDGLTATAANLTSPVATAWDSLGNLYIADRDANRVRKVSAATGLISTVAGTGTVGSSGDLGQAAAAQVNKPWGLAIDSGDNVYIAENIGHRIRRIASATGVITTVAGTGAGGYNVEGAATTAQINGPTLLAFEPSGNLLLCDRLNHRIRRLTVPGGLISTVAGTGAASFTGDGAAANLATLNQPYGVTTDMAGNIYIADGTNHRIRKITLATGFISTVAGSASAGYSGDGAAATAAQLSTPTAVAVDAGDNLFITEFGNSRVRKVDGGTGVISTLCGISATMFAGDGAAAANSQLRNPQAALYDATGNLYVVDRATTRTRRINAGTGNISTVVGTGTASSTGDTGPAISATISSPSDIVLDSTGNLYITDSNRVRRMAMPSGIITTVAGNGTAAYNGEGLSPTAARINTFCLAIDSTNQIYLSDFANKRIRRFTPGSGTMVTLAGNGTATPGADGVQATASGIVGPGGVAVSGTTLWFTDFDGHTIRRVNLTTGVITTVAGTGVAGDSGDGGPATLAQINRPNRLTLDARGNLYVADFGNHRIRRISAFDGLITTVAGTGIAGWGGESGLATLARLSFPTGINFASDGSMLVSDTYNHQFRRVF